MNKTELIDAIAARAQTTKTQTATILNGFMETVQKTLAKGDTIQLVGFGTFLVAQRASREGRNPATGKTMTIPAKKVVKFRPGKALADAAAATKAPRKAQSAAKPKAAAAKRK